MIDMTKEKQAEAIKVIADELRIANFIKVCEHRLKADPTYGNVEFMEDMRRLYSYEN